MNVTIREDNEYRQAVFDRLLQSTTKSGWAHQHHLWPCVRRGAAERWFEARGREFKPSKTAALYFLRGHSAEFLVADQNKERIFVVYKGVACRPDVITGTPDYPFIEIKSTNFSSAALWKFVRNGVIDMSTDFPMKNYFEQSARYAVALHSTGCRLHVYFTHGDYGDRRSKCPDCGNAFPKGPTGKAIWIEDFYQECGACGYKSFRIDFRAYKLDFDPEYLAMVDEEYDTRGEEFRNAQKASTVGELVAATTPSLNFHCVSCDIGKEIGCEYAGEHSHDDE